MKDFWQEADVQEKKSGQMPRSDPELIDAMPEWRFRTASPL